jgi:hypothetical protein
MPGHLHQAGGHKPIATKAATEQSASGHRRATDARRTAGTAGIRVGLIVGSPTSDDPRPEEPQGRSCLLEGRVYLNLAIGYSSDAQRRDARAAHAVRNANTGDR